MAGRRYTTIPPADRFCCTVRDVSPVSKCSTLPTNCTSASQPCALPARCPHQQAQGHGRQQRPRGARCSQAYAARPRRGPGVCQGQEAAWQAQARGVGDRAEPAQGCCHQRVAAAQHARHAGGGGWVGVSGEATACGEGLVAHAASGAGGDLEVTVRGFKGWVG